MVQFHDDKQIEKMEEFKRAEEARLIQALAQQSGYQYIDLKGVTINPSALRTIPEKQAREGKIVAFERNRSNLSVAVQNPNNPKTEEILKDLKSRHDVSIFMAATSSLEHGWQRYADTKHSVAVKRGVLDVNPDEIGRLSQSLKSPEHVRDHILSIRMTNTARRVSETIEGMFAGALALKASDIHIEPEETGIRLRYRLDGVLHDVLDLERVIFERIVSRIKLLAGTKLNVHDEAQDGRFTFDVGTKDVEIRTSIIPGNFGESIVMRLLDPTVASFNMEQLGLNTRLQQVIENELKHPNGLIITTGPTGSGKTTALYAFLRAVHTPDKKIITIENPVEYQVDDIVQTQISPGYSFSDALRAILRQDPDVIMVGEIRDREVAETAIHAAQTGHLVFSTLHTNSAAQSFGRLIDLGVNYRLIGGAVNIILGQRLVRTLCKECKISRPAEQSERDIIMRVLKEHPQPPAITEPLMIADTGGCDVCNHTGYKGRAGLFEAVLVDTAVEDAIIRDPREHVIRAAAKPQKIPTMLQDGIEKIVQGHTTIAELSRVVDVHKVEIIPDTP